MAIVDGEYKSVIGVESLYYRSRDRWIALATFTPGAPATLAPVTEISVEPNTSSETQYADDAAYDTATSTGETKLTVNVTNIPLQVLATLLGLVYDTINGLVYDNEATPPYVSLGFKSLKSNGSYRYYWYYKGRFEAPKEAAKTKGDAVEFQPQELTFTAIKTTHPFALDADTTSTLKRIVGDEDIAGFDGSAWFTTVAIPLYVAG